MANYCVPEKGKAALLIVSAQRDYLRAGSPLHTKGAEGAVPTLRRLVEGFRAEKAPIYHSVRLYRPDGSNVDACRRQAVEEGMRVCMPGSPGAEVVDELKRDPATRLDPDLLLKGKPQALAPDEWVFYRPRWGAFHGTKLEQALRAREITTLVTCGFSFSTGLRATIYEASARDFRLVLVPDAVCCATEEAIKELGRIGIYLMTSDSCLKWLSGSGKSHAAA